MSAVPEPGRRDVAVPDVSVPDVSVPDVAVIVTASRERRLIHPGLRAIASAAAYARREGIRCEVAIVLDDPHPETLALAEEACRAGGTLAGVERATVVVVAAGGSARARGIEVTTAPMVGFVRAADLVSEGWIAGAVATLRARPAAVVHPDVQFAFGEQGCFRTTPSTDDADFALWGLVAADGWDDLGFARRELFAAHPLPAPGLDLPCSPLRAWHWATLEAGVEHVVAAGTSLHRRVDELHDDPFEIAAADELAPVSAGLRDRSVGEAAVAGRSGWTGPSAPAPGRTPGTVITDAVVGDWWRLYDLEPLTMAPTPGHVAALEHRPWVDDEGRAVALAYWRAVLALPDAFDALFLAPGLRMAGGDSVVLNYLHAVRQLKPEWDVALGITEVVESTRLDEVPDGMAVAELGVALLPVEARPAAQARVFALLASQFRPELIHVHNTSHGPFDMMATYGERIASSTRVFLTAFNNFPHANGVIRGQMLRRRADYLDHVTGFITDCASFRDELYDRWRYDPAKLFAHYQPAVLADYVRTEGTRQRRKILWAGRFDWQKRLDVLADVVEELAAGGVDAEVHLYGQVVWADADVEPHLQRLAAAGAVVHPPFTDGVGSLPLDEFAMVLMTPMYEGLPVFLTEVVSAGLPVVAPAVGGIPEIIGEGRGYLVSRTEAVGEYVAQIRAVLDDPAQAHRRAMAARELVGDHFTWETFLDRVRETPGYLGPARRPAIECAHGAVVGENGPRHA